MEIYFIAAVVAVAGLAFVTLARKRSCSDIKHCADSGCPLVRHCGSGQESSASRAVMALLVAFMMAAAVEANEPNALKPIAPSDLIIESSPEATSWKTKERLLASLGGLRTWLSAQGVELELISVDGGFSHPASTSATSDGSTYHGMTDLVMVFDTESSGLWRGGTLSFDLQIVRGGDISACLDDVQGVSNIVGPSGTRFVEYHFEQVTDNGALRFKVGKQDANTDFAASQGGSDFLNSSFGLLPTVPIPTFPAPALGLMAGWRLANTVEFNPSKFREELKKRRERDNCVSLLD